MIFFEFAWIIYVSMLPGIFGLLNVPFLLKSRRYCSPREDTLKYIMFSNKYLMNLLFCFFWNVFAQLSAVVSGRLSLVWCKIHQQSNKNEANVHYYSLLISRRCSDAFYIRGIFVFICDAIFSVKLLTCTFCCYFNESMTVLVHCSINWSFS